MTFAETRQDRNGNWHLVGEVTEGILGKPQSITFPQDRWTYLGCRYETVVKQCARRKMVWASYLYR